MGRQGKPKGKAISGGGMKREADDRGDGPFKSYRLEAEAENKTHQMKEGSGPSVPSTARPRLKARSRVGQWPVLTSP